VVSLKNNAIPLLVGIALGIAGAFVLNPVPESPKEAKIQQQQNQDCKVVIREKVKSDGSVERRTDVHSGSSQEQSVSLGSRKEKLNSLSLVNDELSYAYKLYENDLFSAGPLGQIRKDGTAKLGIQIQW
jgi:hypothetical protein